VHQKVGSAIRVGTGTGRFEIDCRLLYDPTKFGPGTEFFHESTAKETGGSSHQYLNDSGLQDTSVDGVTRFSATTATEISGTWTDPNNILAQDGSLAQITLNVALDTAILEISGYDFDSVIPSDAVIYAVDLIPRRDVDGQTATLSAYFRISGSDQTVHSTSLVVDGLRDVIYTCLGDRTWARSDLLDASMAVRVKATQPDNTTPTTFMWDNVSVYVGWADPVAESQLDYSTSIRERQRTADLSGVLVDGNRYFVYYSSSSGQTIINHSPSFLIALVTGTAAPVGGRHDFWPMLIRFVNAYKGA
jgi:hypothetical protein